MQVTETLSDGLKRNYTVVLPVADLESRRTERLTTLGKTLRLPGFRPGKVPMPIVKQRYGTAVSAEVLEDSVSEATQKVLSERGLRPAQQPKVDLVTENPTALTSDLEFTVALELLPDIALPDFSTIELTRFKAEVSPEAVEKALEQIAKYNRTLEPIAAETIEARGSRCGGGRGPDDRLRRARSTTCRSRAARAPISRSRSAAPASSLVSPNSLKVPARVKPGRSTSPSRRITARLTWPARRRRSTSPSSSSAPRSFRRSTTTWRRSSVPTIWPRCGEMVTSRQQQEFDGLSRMRLKKALLDALTGLADFPVPASIADQEFDQIWQQFEAARKAGTQDEEDKGKDDDTLRAEYRAIAERRVRLGLLLAEIGRVNDITVTEQELNRALYQRAMQYPGQEAQMLEFFKKYPQLTDSVRGPLLEDKVVDFVLELAKVTDTVVSPEELAKDADQEAAAA